MPWVIVERMAVLDEDFGTDLTLVEGNGGVGSCPVSVPGPTPRDLRSLYERERARADRGSERHPGFRPCPSGGIFGTCPQLARDGGIGADLPGSVTRVCRNFDERHPRRGDPKALQAVCRCRTGTTGSHANGGADWWACARLVVGDGSGGCRRVGLLAPKTAAASRPYGMGRSFACATACR